MQVNVTTNKSVYEIGLDELHHVSQDETAHKRIDSEFREARGREGARLHVMLKTISEAERRTAAAIQDLSAAVGAFEQVAGKQFQGVHDDLKARAEALTIQINSFANAEHEHFATVKNQLTAFQQAIWNQNDTHFNAVSTQVRESTERLAFDTRKLRDEVVSLVDARLNQADASFAAIRGDIEVVKYLVMDLIKDRIGRSDPKAKPF